MSTNVKTVEIQKSIIKEIRKISEMLDDIKNKMSSLVRSLNDYTSMI